ncbi:Coiled-coil domain-containing protein 66 [Plecturocebus cupreus]
MTVNQGNRSLSPTENGKEAKSQYSLHLNSISNQPKDENIMGLFTKTEMVSSVPAENKSILNEYQETSKQTLFTDEQVALKKKGKQRNSTAGAPVSTVKQELQRKWIEEANKQIEGDSQRKIEERLIYSKVILVLNLNCPLGEHTNNLSTSVSLLTFGSWLMSAVFVHLQPEAKLNLQRRSIWLNLLGMWLWQTVEEKRKKKQLEEEQRKKEEQEEELRLAWEREEMQKQYEEYILKQKQKEEIMTLKTNELFQTMQQVQELAQRLKQ